MNLFAKAETLDEIFADNLTALAYRSCMKFRDLLLQLDYKLVNLKIQDYHSDIRTFIMGLNARQNELKQANIELKFQKKK